MLIILQFVDVVILLRRNYMKQDYPITHYHGMWLSIMLELKSMR